MLAVLALRIGADQHANRVHAVFDLASHSSRGLRRHCRDLRRRTVDDRACSGRPRPAISNADGEMAAWFAASNLLPAPPLTGGHLLIAVRPDFMPLLAQHRVQVTVVAAALVLMGVAQHIVRPIRDAILYFVPGS
jgi:hypothetical protein